MSKIHVRESDSKKSWVPIFVMMVILLASLIPFFIISIYSRPAVDDYSYSASTYHLIKSGNWNIFSLIIEAIKTDISFYQNWQGLYTSAFLLALQPGIFGEQYYFIGAIVLIALEFFTLLFFFSTLQRILNLEKYSPWFYSLLVTVLFQQGMPSIVQGLFWYNGAWNYVPFLFFDLVNIAFLLRYIYAPTEKENGWIIASSLLSFIISGGNHVMSFLNIILVFLISIPAWMHGKRKAIISLVVACIGFALMYFAPGTALRQAELPKQGAVPALKYCSIQVLKYLNEWVNLRFIFFLLLFTPLALQISHATNLRNVRLPHPCWLLFLTYMIIYALLCIPYYAMGGFGAARLTNVVWLTFMLLSATAWTYSIIWVEARTQFLEAIAGAQPSIGWEYLGIVLCAGLCLANHANVLLVLKDLRSGEAQEYARQCDERYRAISQLAPGDTIEFDPLVQPESIFFSDASNGAWRDYYGVEVRIREPQPNES